MERRALGLGCLAERERGIFRGLRTIPFMLSLAGDMRAECPDAL